MSVTYRMNGTGEQVVDELADQDMTLPDKPSDDSPQLPADLSDLDDRDLMNLFAEFTAWTDYASAQLGLAVINERGAERRVELAEAEAWKDLPKSSVSASKALITLDIKVQHARNYFDTAYAYRRMVGEMAARFERDAAILSRELTRRTSDAGPKSRRQRAMP